MSYTKEPNIHSIFSFYYQVWFKVNLTLSFNLVTYRTQWLPSSFCPKVSAVLYVTLSVSPGQMLLVLENYFGIKNPRQDFMNSGVHILWIGTYSSRSLRSHLIKRSQGFCFLSVNITFFFMKCFTCSSYCSVADFKERKSSGLLSFEMLVNLRSFKVVTGFVWFTLIAHIFDHWSWPAVNICHFYY